MYNYIKGIVVDIDSTSITLDNNGGFLEITPPEIVLASMSIYFDQKNPWMAYFPTSN